MFKRIVCLLAGHKEGAKTQTQSGYEFFICSRCGSVFAKPRK